MSADWNEWYAPMNMISETGFTMVDLTYFGIQPDGSPGSNYITSIEFWWNSEEDSPTINSARMTFSDGTSTEKNWLTGNFDQFLTWPGAKSQRFDFQGGERLKSMRISRRSNPGFNGISLSTVFGRDWTLVADSTVAGAPPPDHHWTDLDIGSGLLVGARSRAHIFPMGFAFAFLKPVKSLALTNVVYTTTPTNATAPIHMIDHMSKSFPNTTSHDTDWEVSESSTDEQSFEWSVGLAMGLSMTASVSAGFFDIIEASDSVTWSLDASVSTTNRSTESKTVAWKASGLVSPGTEVEVMLRYGKGSFKSGYTGTLHVEMQSGATIDIPCKGNFAQTVVGVEQLAASERALAH